WSAPHPALPLYPMLHDLSTLTVQQRSARENVTATTRPAPQVIPCGGACASLVRPIQQRRNNGVVA
ncbi:MAG: hypothetical protein AAFX99_35445, partial [Myxococcota bacterium]